jgi:hypothetical protein
MKLLIVKVSSASCQTRTIVYHLLLTCNTLLNINNVVNRCSFTAFTNVQKDQLIDQLLSKYFAFVRYWRKKWEYNGTVHQLFIDFKTAYDSVRREVLYNILIEFGIPMKLVRLIKMCSNETYSKIRMGKHLSACHSGRAV